MNLSTTDRAILSAMQLNARASMPDIARSLNCREHKIRYSIEKLLGNGAIYPVTRIDMQALGLRQFLIWGSLTAHGTEILPKLIQEIQKIKCVGWAGFSSGEYDIWMEAYVRDETEIDAIFSRLSAKFGSVIRDRCVLNEMYYVRFGNKEFLSDSSASEIVFGAAAASVKSDRLDIEILQTLSADPLISVKKLSQQVKAPIETTNYRIRRMVSQGIILGWQFGINALNHGNAAFSLMLKLPYLDKNVEGRLRSFCRQHPRILGYGRFFGEWDIELHFETADPADLYILRGSLTKALGIEPQKWVVHSILRILKRQSQLSDYVSSVETDDRLDSGRLGRANRLSA